MQGRILKGIGGFYYISHQDKVIMCTARGILKRNDASLCVGDIVQYESVGDDEFVITDVLTRRNYLTRPPVSNLDLLVVTFAAMQPAPAFYAIDKLCVGAEHAGIDVLICINKIDLVDRDKLEEYVKIYSPAYQVVCVNALSREGMAEMHSAIAGKGCSFAGASGVGKSTIVNSLIGDEVAQTGSIGTKMQRGKHTTRHVEIFTLSDGTNIYDTPGFTSIDPPRVEQGDLGALFPEFKQYRAMCKYSDCVHVNEPECAIKQALERGDISQSRYESYKAMLEEVTKWHK